MNVEEIQARLRDFATERDWEQFHTPKNLAMALTIEASELMELFQWLTPEESGRVMDGDHSEAVRDEVADVMIYLLRLADVLNVDLGEAVDHKLAKNGERYTVERSRGSASKVTE